MNSAPTAEEQTLESLLVDTQIRVRELERENREKDAQLEKEKNSRKHTQTWYASHYGKLEDWARKRLPEPWRNEFFSCIANGTWGHADVGERYRCNAGFDVVPSGYIHMDDAKGQLILDQTRRAEEAIAQLAEKDARIAELENIERRVAVIPDQADEFQQVGPKA